jgi:DNA-binding response OmpR family regulator
MEPKAAILYVEDDLALSYVTRDNLEEQGYAITHCADGETALKEFSKKKYDLVLLDIMLPRMDGFTLAKKIREKNSQVPLLFLTAKSMKEDRLTGLKLGADDYIVKPFSIEELILKIEVFLRRSRREPGSQQPVYDLDGIIFDFEKLTLEREGSLTSLTQKEAELLRFFCENKNRTLKREEILLAVWGNDDYFIGRSLDVFISRLRKYLSAGNKIKIVNIHGVGFRMEGEI